MNFELDVKSPDIISPIINPLLTGNHEREGILIMSGRNITEKAIGLLSSIEDVAPTVLYLLGLPVPDDMDERVIGEAIKDEYLKENPVEFCSATPLERRNIKADLDDGWESKEDMESVKARLRGLGYID